MYVYVDHETRKRIARGEAREGNGICATWKQRGSLGRNQPERAEIP